MRILIVAVLAVLSTFSAGEVEKQLTGAGNLRGSDEERNLRAAGSTSLSTKLSIWKCLSGKDALCFNCDSFCEAFADTYAYTEAVGTAAFSLEQLGVYANCEAASAAIARTYAEVKAQTSVNLKTKSTSSGATDLDIDLSLATATLSFSLAASEAAASASVSGEAVAYTNSAALCQSDWGKNLVLCAGASSGTSQYATASTRSYATGFSGSVGGGATYQKANVNVTGTSISRVKTVLVAKAQSFSLSASGSSSIATAHANLLNANFNSVCLSAVSHHCASPLMDTEPFCGMDPQAACDGALAYAQGCAGAFASAFAVAFGQAAAQVNLGIILKTIVSGSGAVSFVENQGYGEAAVASFCIAG